MMDLNLNTVQALITIVLTLVGGVLSILIRLGYIKVKEEDQRRLQEAVLLAVNAAEEIGRVQQLTSAQKLEYAKDLVTKFYPKAEKDMDLVEDLIHAVLSISRETKKLKD
jgi:hypothetical protein